MNLIIRILEENLRRNKWIIWKIRETMQKWQVNALFTLGFAWLQKPAAILLIRIILMTESNIVIFINDIDPFLLHIIPKSCCG